MAKSPMDDEDWTTVVRGKKQVQGKFWASEEDQQQEEDMAAPMVQEIILVASAGGFSLDEIIEADKEL
jgi:hypothetical protein